MTAPKHSAGPWYLVYHGKMVEVVASNGDVVADNQPEQPTAITIENAHLISAAPDLLDTLFNLVMCVEMEWKTENVCGVARLVMKKAHGELYDE